MMRKTVFLWDIDGTLLLTGGSGRAAFNRVFEEAFQEKDIWQNYDPHGKTDFLIINDVFQARFGRLPTPDEVKKISDSYRKGLREDLQNAKNFRLMPQAQETLETLSQLKQVSLGLATGNFKDTAYEKLSFGKLDHYFAYGGFGCDALERETLTRKALERARDHIGHEPEQVYVIGDTIHDVRCGAAIGAITIAVLTGGGTAEELRRAGATHVIQDLTEFFRIVKL
jgi:phosphoglycolate phosphatase